MYDPIPLQIRGGFDGVEAASAPLRHRSAGGGDMKKSEKLQGGRMAEKQIIVRKRTMWKGVGEAARRIGVTGPHLSMVLDGKRKSKRTMDALRRHNVKVEA